MRQLDEIAEVASKRDRDRGDGSRLVHDESRPSIEERCQISVRHAEEDVLQSLEKLGNRTRRLARK